MSVGVARSFTESAPEWKGFRERSSRRGLCVDGFGAVAREKSQAAARASLLMRSTMARRPFARWGVKC